jgi:tRNA G46 methylase TrmB
MRTKLLRNFLHYSSVDLEISMLKFRLRKRPRKVSGNVKVCGWEIDYVDNLALLSSLEILVQKGWNDFLTENETPLILDCGANIGISVLNYRRKYPSAKIIAFEPDPTFLPVLKKNLETNQAADVSIVEAAVWTRS